MDWALACCGLSGFVLAHGLENFVRVLVAGLANGESLKICSKEKFLKGWGQKNAFFIVEERRRRR